MNLAVAQTRPIAGNIAANLARHLDFIRAAIARQAGLIVFPELSLSGYEPTLAAQLATDAEDPRFAVLQQLSDEGQVAIAVGIPLRTHNQPQIGMLIFRPQQAVLRYGKQYLHASEQASFSSASSPAVFSDGQHRIAPAICYEVRCAAHVQTAAEQGANLYMASICASKTGIANDVQALSSIARQYGMPVMMANYVGISGDYDCAGQSGFWDAQGQCLAQLDDEEEALLLYDSASQAVHRIAL